MATNQKTKTVLKDYVEFDTDCVGVGSVIVGYKVDGGEEVLFPPSEYETVTERYISPRLAAEPRWIEKLYVKRGTNGTKK